MKTVALCVLAVFAPAAIAAPAPQLNMSWTNLPESIKGTILHRFNPDSLSKMLLVSKKEAVFALKHFDAMQNLTMEERRHWLYESLKASNQLLFRLLLRKEKVAFPDDEILMDSCAKGLKYAARAFFLGDPMVTLPFHDMHIVLKRCLERAAENDQAAFLKETGLPSLLRQEDLIVVTRRALADDHFDASSALAAYLGLSPHVKQSFDILVASCSGNTKAIEQLAATADEDLTQWQTKTFFRNLGFLTTPHRETFLRNSTNLDPLECAAAKGHIETTAFLFSLNEQGANFTVSEFAIESAMRFGDSALVNRLLSGHSLSSPLSSAAYSGRVEYVQQLVDNPNFNPSRSDIWLAKSNARSLAVLQLIQQHYGVQPFDQNIQIAVDRRLEDIVDFYLDSPHFDDYYFDHLTCRMTDSIVRWNNTRILRKFLGKISHRMEQGTINNCLVSTSYAGNIEMMHIMLDLIDADPAANENQLIVIAAKEGKFEFIKHLVALHEKYPSIDPAARQNLAFLHALKRSDFKMMRYLLSLRDQFPGISPSDRNNFAIKACRVAGLDNLVAFLVSLPQEMGVDASVASMDKSSILVDMDFWNNMN